MDEKEKREAYIRASDKRVCKWPEAKQEAFASSVNRIAGVCAPVVTEPTRTDLLARVNESKAVIQGFLNEIPVCNCHPAFADRGRQDPSCTRCYFAEQIAVAEKWLQEGE